MKKAKTYNYLLFALLLMTTMTLGGLYGFSCIVVIIAAVATGVSFVASFWLEEETSE